MVMYHVAETQYFLHLTQKMTAYKVTTIIGGLIIGAAHTQRSLKLSGLLDECLERCILPVVEEIVARLGCEHVAMRQTQFTHDIRQRTRHVAERDDIPRHIIELHGY